MHPTFRENPNERLRAESGAKAFERVSEQAKRVVKRKEMERVGDQPHNSIISENFMYVYIVTESTLCNIWLMPRINKSKSMLGYFGLATM